MNLLDSNMRHSSIVYQSSLLSPQVGVSPALLEESHASSLKTLLFYSVYPYIRTQSDDRLFTRERSPQLTITWATWENSGQSLFFSTFPLIAVDPLRCGGRRPWWGR